MRREYEGKAKIGSSGDNWTERRRKNSVKSHRRSELRATWKCRYVGLHQRSTLNPYPFTLLLNVLSTLKDLMPWCMLYTNDIVLVGESRKEINKVKHVMTSFETSFILLTQ